MFETERFTIGWICALQTELVAARLLLDEVYSSEGHVNEANDNNSYHFGRIGPHDVVIAVLSAGEYGTNSAATVARDLVRSFGNVRIALLVGIGGGAPLMEPEEKTKQDIRLGDVVVSIPAKGQGGVFQYGFGESGQNRIFFHTGHLNQPPAAVLTVLASLGADFELGEYNIDEDITKLLATKRQRLQEKYQRPDDSTDRLFSSSHTFEDEQPDGNDSTNLVQRPERDHEDRVMVHPGLIASGNYLMKDALLRNTFAREKGVLCFEMEAAGLANQFPYLVIRGICDYCDTHKNDAWHGYAAMTAAMYAKLLLLKLAPSKVEAESRLSSFQKIRRDIKHVAERVEHAALRVDIEKWLAAPDPSTNHNNALKLRHQKSGDWVFQSDIYKQWATTKQQALWLYGISGSGKTVLSSTIIEHLKVNANPSTAVLYFYFDVQDRQKQKLDSALRSLITQFCHAQGADRARLDQLHNSCKRGIEQPAVTALRDCLMDMCQNVPVCIVLDALDESPIDGDCRAEVVDWIKHMTEKSRVQLLATSRPEHDIKTTLVHLPSCEISGDSVDADIAKFIDGHVYNPDGELKRWRGHRDVQEKIKTTLVQKAGGMFRLVALQLGVLRKCTNLKSLNEALQKLPTDLNKMYDRTVQEIARSPHKEEAIRVLQFLAYSKRPLRLEELVDALAVDLDSDPAFDVRNRTPDLGDMALYCPGLTQVVYRTSNNEDCYEHFVRLNRVAEVQLAHASVREYLHSHRAENTLREYLQESYAKAVIVQVSVAYLLAAAHDPQMALPQPEEDYYEIRFPTRDLRFSAFAARYWLSFASVADSTGGAAVQWMLKFMTDEKALVYWLTIFPSYTNFGTEPEPKFLAIHYAAVVGAVKCMACLIEPLAAADVQVHYRATYALKAAAYHGHLELFNLLIDHGAEVLGDPDCPLLAEAFLAASHGGCDAIVRLLLDRGVDIEAQDERQKTALHFAATRGRVSTTELLISEGADVHTRDDSWDSLLEIVAARSTDILRLLLQQRDRTPELDEEVTQALQIAAAHGDIANVALLLDFGADMNAADPYLGSALQAASMSRRIEIVQFLLDHGADINAQGGEFGSALKAAVSEYDEYSLDLVTLLLENGADVNAQGGRDHTALQTACHAGRKDVVRMLLDRGANVNAQGGTYCTALQAASFNGEASIVRMLLAHEANVNLLGGCHNTALQAASVSCDAEVVRMLLDHDADVNIEGGEHHTALLAALSRPAKSSEWPRDHVGKTPLGDDWYFDTDLFDRSRTETVELLLDHGARFYATTHGFDTALRTASFHGELWAVRLLFEWSSITDVDGSFVASALANTPLGGRAAVLKLLADCEKGAVTAGKKCGHAFFAAWARGHTEIVRLFQDRGFCLKDVRTDDLGRTGLHLAATYGYLAGVEESISAGADLNVQDKQCRTPLHWAARLGQARVVRRLRDAGADMSQPSFSNTTARDAAIDAGHWECAQLLAVPQVHEVTLLPKRRASNVTDECSQKRQRQLGL